MSNFQKVGIVGAGMMGSEIALMFALAGHPTHDGRRARRGRHRYDGGGKRK
jgi:3-hydroxyacyl-CoA dehydrogenase